MGAESIGQHEPINLFSFTGILSNNIVALAAIIAIGSIDCKEIQTNLKK